MTINTSSKEKASVEVSAADQTFAQAIGSSLNKSLADIDDFTLAKLARARKAALEQKSAISGFRKATWASLAAAASIFAVMIIPGQDYLSSTSEQYNDELSYLSVDPQWLEDMEMLEALEGEYDEV